MVKYVRPRTARRQRAGGDADPTFAQTLETVETTPGAFDVASGQPANVGRERKPSGDTGTAMTVYGHLRMYEEAEEVSRDSHKSSSKARLYYSNVQWTSDEIATLNLRRQPVAMQNKIKPKIDYLTGLEIKRRTQPKVYPTRPVYQEDADACTQVLRYLTDKTDLPQIKSEVWEEMLVEGGPTGALVAVEYNKQGKPVLKITHTPWDRVFVDPHARRRDFEDARYKGIVIWMDRTDAEETWSDHKDAITSTFTRATELGSTYDDRPASMRWADTRRDRVRVIELYYKQGDEWWQCTLTGGGYLVEPAKVVYVDQDGETDCPLTLVANYRRPDNTCFGLVEELISRQDEINKRRSKFLHMVTMRQARVSRKAANAQKISEKLADPAGIVVAEKDEFEILPTGDMAEGHYKLLLASEQEMDQSTANAALTGTQDGAPSGRAILANQQGGQIQAEAPLDRLRHWQKRVWTKAWNRVRQYWTAEEWVRVTGDPSNMRWVGINLPMTNADKMARDKGRPLTKHELSGFEARTGLKPTEPYIDPVTQKPMLKTVPAELTADIIIDEGPDTVTIAQEQFENLMQMPPEILAVIGAEGIIELSSLPNKERVLEIIKARSQMMPPGMGMPGMPPGAGPALPGQPAALPAPQGAAGGPGGAMPPQFGPPDLSQVVVPPGGSAAVMGPNGQMLHPPLDDNGMPLALPPGPPLPPPGPPVTPQDEIAAEGQDQAHEQEMARLAHDREEAAHRREMEKRKQTLAEGQHKLAVDQFSMQNPHAQNIAALLGAMGNGQGLEGEAAPGAGLAQTAATVVKGIGALLRVLAAPTEFIYGEGGQITGTRKLMLQNAASETLADMAQGAAGPAQSPLETLQAAFDELAMQLAQAVEQTAAPKLIKPDAKGRPDEIVSSAGPPKPDLPKAA